MGNLSLIIFYFEIVRLIKFFYFYEYLRIHFLSGVDNIFNGLSSKNFIVKTSSEKILKKKNVIINQIQKSITSLYICLSPFALLQKKNPKKMNNFTAKSNQR